MRRVFAIAVIAEVCIFALVLHNEIKDFLFVHQWWQSFIAAMPGIAAPILAWFDLQHSREANNLRAEANNHRIRANGLQEDLNSSVTKIAELTEELDTERNKHLQQIAANTKRPKSEAEINAQILKKYLGHRAFVGEGDGDWGGGAIVADVNENNIVTLFVPASHYNSQAYGQPVRCEKIHVVEEPTGGFDLQVRIIERYGTHTTYGDARSWEERNVRPAHAGMQRGTNVFHAQYRKDGSAKLRNIYVYASMDGSSNYTLVAAEDEQETNSWYSGKLDIEKKFALVNVEWADLGYRHVGGSGNGNLNLFIRK